MLYSRKKALVGYGGHAYVVADSYISSGKKLNYYIDFESKLNNPFNLKYLGCETDINFKGWTLNIDYILGIGDNRTREAVGKLILNNTKKLQNVIHPSSIISKFSNLGIGIFISKGVLLNSFAKIGDFVILNSGCIIEHECTIELAAHIAPGAVLAGNVRVGKRSFIGANSVIKEGVTIGDDVIIGAGSVIIKNVPSNTKIVGNPGKSI